MTNENEILAQKRAWSKSNVDRRRKDGSKEDRKLTADCIRAGRSTDKKIQDIERRTEYSAFMLAICIVLAVIVFFIFPKVF